MADNADWTLLTITDRDLEGPNRGRVTLLLTLSASPPPEWKSIFILGCTHRNGSGVFVNDTSNAEIAGNTIRWSVPTGVMEDAFRLATTSLNSANAQYADVLRQREQLTDKAAAQTIAAATQHDQLKQRLQEL